MRTTKGPGRYECKVRIGEVVETEMWHCPYCQKLQSANATLETHIHGNPTYPEWMQKKFAHLLCAGSRDGRVASTPAPEVSE